VVFFYEGSGLQVAAGVLVSVGAIVVYTYSRPYLMRSNNTFAIFAHFQVTFTLFCALLLRMEELASKDEDGNLSYDNEQLGMALLISNVSVLAIGVLLMAKACMTTSEGDFVDTGFVYNEKTGKYEIEDMGGNDDEEEGNDPEGGGGVELNIFEKHKDVGGDKTSESKITPKRAHKKPIRREKHKKQKAPSEQYLTRQIKLGDNKFAKSQLKEYKTDKEKTKAEADKKANRSSKRISRRVQKKREEEEEKSLREGKVVDIDDSEVQYVSLSSKKESKSSRVDPSTISVKRKKLPPKRTTQPS